MISTQTSHAEATRAKGDLLLKSDRPQGDGGDFAAALQGELRQADSRRNEGGEEKQPPTVGEARRRRIEAKQPAEERTPPATPAPVAADGVQDDGHGIAEVPPVCAGGDEGTAATVATPGLEVPVPAAAPAVPDPAASLAPTVTVDRPVSEKKGSELDTTPAPADGSDTVALISSTAPSDPAAIKATEPGKETNAGGNDAAKGLPAEATAVGVAWARSRAMVAGEGRRMESSKALPEVPSERGALPVPLSAASATESGVTDGAPKGGVPLAAAMLAVKEPGSRQGSATSKQGADPFVSMLNELRGGGAATPSPAELRGTEGGATPAAAVAAPLQPPVTSSASPAVAIAVPVRAQGWDHALGERVVWLHQNGLEEAEIHLTPRHLGPVEVRITLQQDQATVNFAAPTQAARDALEAALPKLREMMQESGLNLVQAEVSQQNPERRQSGFGGEGSRQGGEPRGSGDALMGGAEAASTPAPAVLSTLLRGVDYYA